MHRKFFLVALLFALSIPASFCQTPAPAPAPQYYRPSGCDTLLTVATEKYHCSCNCVTFNPKWITDTDPASTGLNIKNLVSEFDIQMPEEIFTSCGRLIGLDTDGNRFSALFSATTDKSIITTRFEWRYACRSGAFFLESRSRKVYKKE